MAKYPKIIKSAYVYTLGDPSVGLNGQSATIRADGDFLIDLDVLDEADVPQVIETFRQNLITTFTTLWDEPPHVVFDFEMPD